MASHVLFDCETLALLRFRHLGHHFWKQVALPASPSARYCTLFTVWGHRTLKHRVAQKFSNSWGARVIAVYTLMNSAFYHWHLITVFVLPWH